MQDSDNLAFLKTSYKELVNLDQLPDILDFWLQLGVDGFNFLDLHLLVGRPHLVSKIQDWRNTLDRFGDGLNPPIIMAPVKLLEMMETKDALHVNQVSALINLIDMPLDISGSSDLVIIYIILFIVSEIL